MRDKDIEDTVKGCVALGGCLIWAAFYIGIAYVAWHFIAKLW